jgi:rRNA maturation endonuclease Nob1
MRVTKLEKAIAAKMAEAFESVGWTIYEHYIGDSEKWCLKCKIDYSPEDFSFCPDCGSELNRMLKGQINDNTTDELVKAWRAGFSVYMQR